MNRALLAMLVFALLFAAGLAWLRYTLPAPELRASPEMLPADAIFYAATRQPRELLASEELRRWPRLAAELAELPIDALALGLLPLAPGPDGLRGIVLVESRDPAQIETAVRRALPTPPWREEQHQVLRARWSTFHREGHPVLALYRGTATFALALGTEPLVRLIGSKRHGSGDLADRPEFSYFALVHKAEPVLVWSDRSQLEQVLLPLMRDESTTAWTRELASIIARSGRPPAKPVP